MNSRINAAVSFPGSLVTRRASFELDRRFRGSHDDEVNVCDLCADSCRRAQERLEILAGMKSAHGPDQPLPRSRTQRRPELLQARSRPKGA